MATRIRFTRRGSKKKPFYRLVVADKRAPRDGRFIERIGTYDPMLASDNKDRFQFNKERIEYWLSTGAVPSEKVAIFLYNNGFKSVENHLPASYPKTEAERKKLKEERLAKEKAEKEKKEAEAKKAAEEAAAAAAPVEAPAAEGEAPASDAAEAPAEEAKSEEKPAEEAKTEAPKEEAKPEEAPAEEAKSEEKPAAEEAKEDKAS